MSKTKTKLILILGTVAFIVMVGVIAVLVLRPKVPDISLQIQKRVGFTIFHPISGQSDWQIDKTTVNYDSNAGVLTFDMYTKDHSNKIVMSQQATPSPFTDIENYSAIFLSKLNAYQEFQVSLGTVDLIKPTELKGEQAATANIGGTLMFLHPDHSLDVKAWTSFFNGLEKE